MTPTGSCYEPTHTMGWAAALLVAAPAAPPPHHARMAHSKQIYRPSTWSHVPASSPKVCVSHLAGAVDDAAHDGDGHARQVAGARPDLVSHLLQQHREKRQR